jgi:YHS domain-containing protein
MRHQSTIYFMLLFFLEEVWFVRFSNWWNIEKKSSSTKSWYFHVEIFFCEKWNRRKFKHDEARIFRQYLNHQCFFSSLFSQSCLSMYSFFSNQHERVFENCLNHVNKYSINHFLIYSYSIHKQINLDSKTKWSTWCEYEAKWSMRCANEIIKWWKIAKCNDDECKQTSFHWFVVINIIHWRD